MKKQLTIGITAAAVAAGAYFFLGPDGKKHRKQMKSWMVQMKGDVLEKLEDAKEVTEPVYNEIIDTVADSYAVANKIPRSEIGALAKDLKRHWNTIRRAMNSEKPKRTKNRGSKKSRRTTTKTA